MNADNLIELFFGDMEKLGPGDNIHTLHVLHLLPRRHFEVIVDVGCGSGRQTIVLANELATLVHAVDTHEPFLHELQRRAREAGMEHLVQTHHIDMKDITAAFPHIDLLWSEGAAYNIGFSNALCSWVTAIEGGAFAVVSELSWLRERIPDRVKDFFLSGYPGMHSAEENVTAAESAGYNVVATYTIPQEAWVDGYYDILGPRAKALVDHPDPSVREFAAETLKEIGILECSEGSYGYVFYVLQRA